MCRIFLTVIPTTKHLSTRTGPLNTPGGLGKEIKGNMQGTNILGGLEIDYIGQWRTDKFSKTVGLKRTLSGNIGHNIFSRTQHPTRRRNQRWWYHKHTWVFEGRRHPNDQTSNCRSDGRQPRTHNIPHHLRQQRPTYFRNSVHLTPAQNIHNIGGV